MFQLFQTFSKRLIGWYEQHKRKLPWRDTRDAYLIWLSEIILQQTRVEQGTPYYLRFVNLYPTIADLANAPIDDILKLWQGLGYYSRARNLHDTAVFIKEHYNGVFPNEFSEIITLKGIGKYTASAIASFAFNKPYPVVDGNVMRVICRLWGIYLPIDSKDGKIKIDEIVNKLIDKENPASFNQAIMEFGALQCTPVNPLCNQCVFRKDCFSFKNNCIEELPVKSKKIKQKERFFNYIEITLISNNKKYLYLKKRQEKDIWKGLYDFPMIESKVFIDTDHLFSGKDWQKIIGKNKFKLMGISNQYKHQLTHQKILAQFIHISISDKLTSTISKSYILTEVKDFKNYAIPRLIDKYYYDKIKKPQTR